MSSSTTPSQSTVTASSPQTISLTDLRARWSDSTLMGFVPGTIAAKWLPSDTNKDAIVAARAGGMSENISDTVLFRAMSNRLEISGARHKTGANSTNTPDGGSEAETVAESEEGTHGTHAMEGSGSRAGPDGEEQATITFALDNSWWAAASTYASDLAVKKIPVDKETYPNLDKIRGAMPGATDTAVQQLTDNILHATLGDDGTALRTQGYLQLVELREPFGSGLRMQMHFQLSQDRDW